ncbi:hypothetical protein PVAND_016443 [Polypedilum vanderplanki]|uniref:Uncharacterized protein n=1 Tax=Polypedilum vanderplanki TaxID=319348 RepID=A0A9J6BFU4_POLVA|nr:hypothetical protein PVAND_016443 [Polypedilum vanderplanki]
MSESSSSSQSMQKLRQSSKISMKKISKKSTNIANNSTKKIKKIHEKEQKTTKETQNYETDNDEYSSFSENEGENSQNSSARRKSKRLRRRQPSYKDWQQNEILRRMYEDENSLRHTINEICTKYAQERQEQQTVMQNFQEQQEILWNRLITLQNNSRGYQSIVGSLNAIMDSLKNRLIENGIEVNENVNEEEINVNEE